MVQDVVTEVVAVAVLADMLAQVGTELIALLAKLLDKQVLVAAVVVADVIQVLAVLLVEEPVAV